MSVIVVGNGPSVLDKPLGKEIDKFDTVVRLNYFEFEPVECTGEKIDIWFTGRVFDIPKQALKQRPMFLLKCGPKRRDGKEVYAYEKLHDLAYDTSSDIRYYPLAWKRPFKYEYYDQRGSRRISPSAGLFAVNYFLKTESTVYIHGFDGLKYNERHHYFDKKVLKSRFHRSKVEQRYVDTWIKEGRVKKLHSSG